MAPTALPAFATYEDLSATPRPDTSFGRLVAAATWWSGWALRCSRLQLQLVLFQMDLLTCLRRQPVEGLLSAVLLAGAGLYQFSTREGGLPEQMPPPADLLYATLGRRPAAQWRAAGPCVPGLLLGADAAGLCRRRDEHRFFMGLATIIMVLEKLPDLGRRITRPLGVVLLIAGAAWMALSAL